MKKVIITGVTGMDGSYMADHLLENTACTIIAGIRRLSNENHKNINHLKGNPRFKLIDLDITDSSNIEQVIREEQPDYFINFAANSFVGNSWTMPVNHMQTNCMAVLYQLEAIRKFAPKCRYYNAGSSEEFGDVQFYPQTEKHPLRPRSPYGASKASARMLVKVYRESYGLYAIQGWLFNHESERRGVEFVTRKITTNVARIKKEIQNGEKITPLELGNLDAKRDWSHAEDFVDGVWRMLNQDRYYLNDIAMYEGDASILESDLPKYIKEYVLASGETHTIREFVERAFTAANIQGRWSYSMDCDASLPLEQTEIFVSRENQGVVLVKINPDFYRPAEVELLLGDASLAKNDLGWKPKNNLDKLVYRMVNHDINNV
jgi:GDPmannose 4,6-dehydratase